MDHNALRNLWPEEASIDQARRQSPQKPAMKHGGYSPALKTCWEGCPLALAGRCDCPCPGQECPIERARYDAMLPVYREIVAQDGVLDLRVATPMISDAVLAMIQYERILAWAAIMPEVTRTDAAAGAFEIQGGHKAIAAFRHAWHKAQAALLLTGPARMQLDAERQAQTAGGVAAMIVEMSRQALAAPAAEVVDAEFEDDDLRQDGNRIGGAEQDGTTTAQDTANDNGQSGDGDDNDEEGETDGD